MWLDASVQTHCYRHHCFVTLFIIDNTITTPISFTIFLIWFCYLFLSGWFLMLLFRTHFNITWPIIANGSLSFTCSKEEGDRQLDSAKCHHHSVTSREDCSQWEGSVRKRGLHWVANKGCVYNQTWKIKAPHCGLWEPDKRHIWEDNHHRFGHLYVKGHLVLGSIIKIQHHSLPRCHRCIP